MSSEYEWQYEESLHEPLSEKTGQFWLDPVQRQPKPLVAGAWVTAAISLVSLYFLLR